MSDVIMPSAGKAGGDRYPGRGKTADKRSGSGIAGFILFLTVLTISAAVVPVFFNEADAGGDTPIEGSDEILGGTGTWDDPYVVTDTAFWEAQSEYPQAFFHVIISDSVTSIDSYAFLRCGKLRAVDIPASVTSIGDYAFYGCSTLNSVDIPETVTSIGSYAFSGCQLDQITIPSSVTFIGDYAFNDCSTTSLTLLASVTSIGAAVFQHCNFSSIVIPSSVTSIGKNAFNKCSFLQSVTIPSSVTSIGDYAFAYTQLQLITIPSSVTSVGKGAFTNYRFFDGPTQLEYSELPGYTYAGKGGLLDDKLQRIKTGFEFVADDLKFRVSSVEPLEVSVSGCESVPADLIIPAEVYYGPLKFAVTSVGNDSFWDNKALRSVILPSSVKSIGEFAFENCISLQSATIPSSVTSIGYGAFEGCTSLQSATIPSSVKSIGEFAFSGCASLQSVTVPSSVSSIGTGVFRNCTSLQSVAIPSSVTSIGDFAFSGCASLQSVAIPSSVTSIGMYAFYDCTSLRSVAIPSSVASIGESAFDGISFYDGSDLLGYSELPGYTYIGSEGKLYRLAESGSEFVIDNLKFRVLPGESVKVAVEGYESVPAEADLVIPAEVLYGGGRYSVTSVSSNSFFGCTSLQSVFIPSSVASVGQRAFSGCTSLNEFSGTYSGIVSKVMLVSGSALVSCAAGPEVAYVSIPSSVTLIAGYAFYNCTSLRTIGIPSSVTYIGEFAFYNCASLQSATIPSSVTSIGEYAFRDCTSLRSAVIHSSAVFVGGFYNCTSLRSVILPSSVTSIGLWAFSGCTSMQTINIPSSVTYIGFTAFEGIQFYNGITPLDYRELPGYDYEGSDGKLYRFDVKAGTIFVKDNLKYLITSAETMEVSVEGFETAAAETVLAIPAEVSHRGYEFAVTSIGKKAFAGCASLQFAAIPSSIASIGDRAFDGIYFLNGASLLDYSNIPGYNYKGSNGALYRFSAEVGFKFAADGLIFGVSSADPLEVFVEGYESVPADLVIPCKASYGVLEFAVVALGDSLFADCASLQSVTIPSSVTLICPGAFSGCTSLQSVTIPSSVTSIGGSAFSGCTSLQSVTIPSSVTFIEPRAFSGCTSLQTVTIPSSVFYVGEDAFSGCTSLQSVTIPSSVTSVGLRAFGGCTSLNEFSGTYEGIADGIMLISKSAVVSCAAGPQVVSVAIPSSVRSIEDGAFDNCSLRRIDIPSSVTHVSDKAFGGIEFYRGSSLLSYWDIPGHVYEGSDGKMYCLPEPGLEFAENNLKFRILSLEPAEVSVAGYESSWPGTDLAIPAEASYRETIFSVTSAGDSAFRNCRSLLSVTMPSSVTSVGELAFGGCRSLQSVTIPSSVVSVGDLAFSGIEFYSDSVQLEYIELPGYTYEGSDGKLYRLPVPGLEFSEDNLRFYILSLEPAEVSVEGYESSAQETDLVIPAEASYRGTIFAVTAVGDSAFENCRSLLSVTMPSSVTSIGAHAFGGCISLQSADIPSSVVSVGDLAFEGIAFYSGSVLLDYSELPGYVYEGSDGKLYRNSVAIGQKFVSGGLKYTVTSLDPLKVSVTGYETKPVNLVIPGEVSYEESTFKVVSIGSSVFSGCKTLVSADLGSISVIGPKAFYNCGNLKSVDFGNALVTINTYAFHKCYALKDLDMIDSAKTLKNIGSYAFNKCSKLGSFMVPTDVKKVYSGALTMPVTDIDGNPLPIETDALRGHIYKNVGGKLVQQPAEEKGTEFSEGGLVYRITGYLPCYLSVIGYEAGIKSINLVPVNYHDLDYKVVSVGDAAFKNCKTLTSAVLPDVTKIGKDAFNSCQKLVSAEMGKVKTIGQSAFRWCSKLTSLDLGESLLDIKAAAFYNCKSLTSLDLPDSVKNIASAAFKGCSGLGEVSFGTGLSKIESTSFSGLVFKDAEDNVLTKASELCGNTFSGSSGTLYLSDACIITS